MHLVPKKTWFGVEASVSYLSTIVSTHSELLVAGVVRGARSDVAPARQHIRSRLPRSEKNAAGAANSGLYVRAGRGFGRVSAPGQAGRRFRPGNAGAAIRYYHENGCAAKLDA
jgi:hypothetical protein